MLSCAIDARENRNVTVTDIPGALIHAEMDDNVNLLLKIKTAEQIITLDPKANRKYIWCNNQGKSIRVIQLKYESRCHMYNQRDHI